MTSNKMFPLTLKPAKKRNTGLVVSKEKDAQLGIAFIEESARSFNE
jgi:hypothetical protein